MILQSKLSVLPLTPEGTEALSRYREWAKVKDNFGASFIALHEASHAVSAALLDAPFGFTEIVSRIRKDGLYAGYTEVKPAKHSVAHHHRFKLAIIAAAPIVLNAQLKIPDGDQMIDDDQKNIDSLGAQLAAAGSLFVPSSEFAGHVLKWTAGFVPASTQAIQETARQLDRKKKLLGSQVQGIIDRYERPVLPEIVQAVCGLVAEQQAEQIVKSYTDNMRYRSVLPQRNVAALLAASPQA